MENILWQILLRAEADPPRFSADEICQWFRENEIHTSLAGLLCQVENATSIECDSCAEGHVEVVKYVRSPKTAPLRAYIHCPENERVEVPLDRLKQWDVDLQGLATDVASSLDLAGTTEEIVSSRIWSLGKATIAGRSREVFLARGLSWADAPRVLGGCERLNLARSAVVLVVGEVPSFSVWAGDAPAVAPLKMVLRTAESGLSVDRGHLENLLSGGRKKAPPTILVSFPTPAGTAWSDVRLTVAEKEIRVEARGKSKDYRFHQAGFEERRKKGVPDRLWDLLRLFAVHGGVLPFKVAKEKARQNVKQYVPDLRNRLTALLPNIAGDPISYDKDERAYRTAFKISSKDGVKFPTPQGATWAIVSINMTGTSSIHISVVATERFAASSYDDDNEGDTHRWEPAEREGEAERTYDLRTLGLADEKGCPNPAGQALLDVLAGKGTVKRKVYDKGMLELGGVLSKLIDIKGPPFRFDELNGKWVALFDAFGES